MSAEVVRLTEVGPIIEPETGVIAELEELLAQARAGDIKGIGFVVITRSDTVATNWVSGCADQHDMVAGATRLQYRMMKAWDKGVD